MSQTTPAEFEQLLQHLIGKPCWNVQAGAIGSLAALHIGDKVALEKPLPFPNTSLTPDEHKFRGEYILYIEDCPWRLDGVDKVLTSWTDSNAPKGPLVTHMRGLIGKQITQVTLTQPGLDLTVHFDTGETLRIFPDQSDPNEGDNYSLSLPEKTVIIGARSQIVTETN